MALGAVIAGVTAFLIGEFSDILLASVCGMVMGWLAFLLLVQREGKRAVGRPEVAWAVGGAALAGAILAVAFGTWTGMLAGAPAGAFGGALMPAAIRFNRKLRQQAGQRSGSVEEPDQ